MGTYFNPDNQGFRAESILTKPDLSVIQTLEKNIPFVIGSKNEALTALIHLGYDAERDGI